MKADADEKELLESVERGEWKSAGGGKRGRARYSLYAKATFRKDRRLNIRLSSKDLEVIQKRALAEDLPCQTLISSLLHKYAAGRLKEIQEAGRPRGLVALTSLAWGFQNELWNSPCTACLRLSST
jgi:predicted DNA binding CopG/RHH family protein